MNKHRLLNISYDLNIKLAHADMEGQIVFKQFDDGHLGIAFTHYSDYYEKGYYTNYIFEWYSTEKVIEVFEHIKEVIAGERLASDETDSHVPN